ncbi:MAG: hypothetical protein IPP40_14910 [bacterium]|nr:hypothetical protein [bacterium]
MTLRKTHLLPVNEMLQAGWRSEKRIRDKQPKTVMIFGEVSTGSIFEGEIDGDDAAGRRGAMPPCYARRSYQQYRETDFVMPSAISAEHNRLMSVSSASSN